MATQLQVNDFPLKKHKCRITGQIFESIFDHNQNCIYKYCKGGWMFTPMS